MTPAEIVAKTEELRARLQAMAAHKIGFGMDNLFRQVLKAAFELVGLVGSLAKLIDERAPNRSDENSG